MARTVVSLMIFFTLIIIQTSFISSLPGWFSATPLVFATGIYLLQHQGFNDGLWWLIGAGVWMDTFGLNQVPFATIAFMSGALIAFWTSKRLFSNRSFYGIAGCVFLSFAVMVGVESMIAAAVHLDNLSGFNWYAYLMDVSARVTMLAFLITVMFPFATRIRRILQAVSLIPQSQKTYS